LGVNRELVAGVFDVLAPKSEEVENAGADFSDALSAAGVGVAGTAKALLAPVKRFFAGAVAGGAAEKPVNRSPPDALGVAELSVGCSVFDAVVSVGFDVRPKRSPPVLAAGFEAPKMFEVLLNGGGAC
jgi:hypothetical protein